MEGHGDLLGATVDIETVVVFAPPVQYSPVHMGLVPVASSKSHYVYQMPGGRGRGGIPAPPLPSPPLPSPLSVYCRFQFSLNIPYSGGGKFMVCAGHRLQS